MGGIYFVSGCLKAVNSSYTLFILSIAKNDNPFLEPTLRKWVNANNKARLNYSNRAFIFAYAKLFYFFKVNIGYVVGISFGVCLRACFAASRLWLT